MSTIAKSAPEKLFAYFFRHIMLINLSTYFHTIPYIFQLHNVDTHLYKSSADEELLSNEEEVFSIYI